MIKRLIYRILNPAFAWIERALGIDSLRGNLEYYSRQQMDKLVEIQDTLKAMQLDKLKVYINDKPKIIMQMDYETSQVAALEEFKEK